MATLAGIAMSLVLAASATALARRLRRTGMSLSPLGRTRRVFILLVALANGSEAVSYLVPNAGPPGPFLALAVATAALAPWRLFG